MFSFKNLSSIFIFCENMAKNMRKIRIFENGVSTFYLLWSCAEYDIIAKNPHRIAFKIRLYVSKKLGVTYFS